MLLFFLFSSTTAAFVLTIYHFGIPKIFGSLNTSTSLQLDVTWHKIIDFKMADAHSTNNKIIIFLIVSRFDNISKLSTLLQCMLQYF